jgi:hypothetical protein
MMCPFTGTCICLPPVSTAAHVPLQLDLLDTRLELCGVFLRDLSVDLCY